MATSCVAGCVRYSRIIFENSLSLRSARAQKYQYAQSALKRYSSSTEANSEKPEGSENENKLQVEVEKLSKQLEEATEKYSVLEDKYKRALADGENMRLRFQKQIEDAKVFSIQKFCKDLLEVSDILQRATESVPKTEVTDRNPHLKSLYEGLTMTEKELQSVFKRHGLVLVNPVDEKFDPNFHEALFQQEVEGKQPGTVVVVSKVGYKLNERVIRPALVGVAKGS